MINCAVFLGFSVRSTPHLCHLPKRNKNKTHNQNADSKASKWVSTSQWVSSLELWPDLQSLLKEHTVKSPNFFQSPQSSFIYKRKAAIHLERQQTDWVALNLWLLHASTGSHLLHSQFSPEPFSYYSIYICTTNKERTTLRDNWRLTASK